MSQLRIAELARPGLGPVSLTVSAAECVCLSGKSGAGKSLLLRAIADLDVHAGEIWLDEMSCASVRAPRWRRQVGLLPAESQWWYDSVGEHFSSPVDEEMLGRFGFGCDVMGWQVGRCSTGERQRLAMLRLLSGRPRVLLLDEPTASLDQENAQRIEAVIADYRRGESAPVVWVSHDPEQIGRVADRHFRMENGRLAEARR